MVGASMSLADVAGQKAPWWQAPGMGIVGLEVGNHAKGLAAFGDHFLKRGGPESVLELSGFQRKPIRLGW